MTDWGIFVTHFYRQSSEEQVRLWETLSVEQRSLFLEAYSALSANKTNTKIEPATDPVNAHSHTLAGEIDILISLGNDLRSKYSIWTSTKSSHEFNTWRLRSASALRELGPRAEHLLAMVDRKWIHIHSAQNIDMVLGAITAAKSLVARVPANPPQAQNKDIPVQTGRVSDSRSVFIVHGHDKATLQEAARLLSKLGLNPIILSEEVAGGRTIIEKLEQYSNACAALILLTADDVGGAAEQAPRQLLPRARQNVILELGYFVGLLGRRQVVVLYTPGIELPSDYVGVEYIRLDNEGAWKLRVAREFRAADLAVNLNDLA